jgi:hypothetical protein
MMAAIIFFMQTSLVAQHFILLLAGAQTLSNF